ncbi:hypothetical protein, partial [uncultured Microbacterium sp.]|uniref:hypothetical protein n=1 Tax=uncultured Microbacterium sp. TaxID=191216 RepID=UPI002614504C
TGHDSSSQKKRNQTQDESAQNLERFKVERPYTVLADFNEFLSSVRIGVNTPRTSSISAGSG